MKLLSNFYFSLLLAFLTIGCAHTAELKTMPANDDIREALFRFIFSNNASAGQKNVDYYFLSIEKKDPTTEFLNRFQGEKPQVLPSSQAKFNPPPDQESLGGIIHQSLGGTGLKFGIGKIDWINKYKVSISWSYYENMLSGSFNVATLKLKNNAWVVTEDHLLKISRTSPKRRARTAKLYS